MITLLAIGKKHEPWVATGIERYQKRLKAPWNVQWVLLPHSSLEGSVAREQESERLLSRLSPTDYVILLDERGKQYDSPAFSEIIQSLMLQSKRIVVVIGGAYGVSGALHQRADTVLSLSDMVLPHQLVRLVLIEQLYRAQSIAEGSKYHHV